MKHYNADLLNRTLLEPQSLPSDDVRVVTTGVEVRIPTDDRVNNSTGTHNPRFRKLVGGSPGFTSSDYPPGTIIWFVRDTDGLIIKGRVSTLGVINDRVIELDGTTITSEYSFNHTFEADITVGPFSGLNDIVIPAGTVNTRGYGVTANAADVSGTADGADITITGSYTFNTPNTRAAFLAITTALNQNGTDYFRMLTGFVSAADIPQYDPTRKLLVATTGGESNVVHDIGDELFETFDPGTFCTTEFLPHIPRTKTQWNANFVGDWARIQNYVGDLRIYRDNGARLVFNRTSNNGDVWDHNASTDYVELNIPGTVLKIQRPNNHWSTNIDAFYNEGTSHNWRIEYNDSDVIGTDFTNAGAFYGISRARVERNIIGQIK